jgi:hypothetical protein
MNTLFEKPVASCRQRRDATALGFAGFLVFILAGCGGGGGGGGGAVDNWSSVDTVYNAVATDDLNGDGAADLIFSRTSEQNRIGNCDNFDCQIRKRFIYAAAVVLQDSTAPGTFLKEPDYSLNDRAVSVASGDLDGDGRADFAVTREDAGSVGVFAQDPASPAVFLTRRDFPATNLPARVAIGELTGDGVVDMAVAGDDLVLLANDPLSPGSTFTAASLGIDGVTAVAVADIDGDGRNDLAATTGDTVIVRLQDHAPAPAGSFSGSTVYASGSGASAVAIGDLNGDGLPDLAVANRGDPLGSVAVLMQDPDAIGTFLSATNYATDENSTDVEIGDLNDDGLPDLAIANNEKHGGSVSFLLQDALRQGVFLDAVNYPGLRGPEDVAIGDMNGDGLADLVVADKSSNIKEWPYIRFQDFNNPGRFLDPVQVQ